MIFRFYKLWAFIWAAIWVDSLKNSRDRSKTITQHPKILVEKVEEKFFIFDFSQKKIKFFLKNFIPPDSSQFYLSNGQLYRSIEWKIAEREEKQSRNIRKLQFKKLKKKFFIFDFSRKKIRFFQKKFIPSDSLKFYLSNGQLCRSIEWKIAEIHVFYCSCCWNIQKL